jgi:transcriptional regulator with XRE-family HTH domain
MSSSIRTARHKRLAELLAKMRNEAGLHQADVAKALGRHQPSITNIKREQRRVDVVEFLQLARIIGFDPHAIIDELLQMPEGE